MNSSTQRSLTKIWMVQTIVEGLDEDLELIDNLCPPIDNENQDTAHLLKLADQEHIRMEYVELMKHRSQSSGYRRKKQGEQLKDVLKKLHGVSKELLKDPDEGKDQLIKVARRRLRNRARFHSIVKKTIKELNESLQCDSMQKENETFKQQNKQLVTLTQELAVL